MIEVYELGEKYNIVIQPDKSQTSTSAILSQVNKNFITEHYNHKISYSQDTAIDTKDQQNIKTIIGFEDQIKILNHLLETNNIEQNTLRDLKSRTEKDIEILKEEVKEKLEQIEKQQKYAEEILERSKKQLDSFDKVIASFNSMSWWIKVYGCLVLAALPLSSIILAFVTQEKSLCFLIDNADHIVTLFSIILVPFSVPLIIDAVRKFKK